MARIRHVLPALPMLCVAAVTLLGGCGTKGRTKLSYSTPAAPLGITFSIDKDGTWEVAAGVATPIGTFAIGQTFESRDAFTYIVLRDRDKGTDQVFKLTTTGHVDIHAVGEHDLRMEKEDNRWVIETKSVQGLLEIKVFPSALAIARIDFGRNDPDFVLSTDRKLIVEPPGWIGGDQQSIPLDSVQTVRLVRRFIPPRRWICFDWRDGIDTERLEVPITESGQADANFDVMKATLSEFVPHLTFEREDLYLISFLWLLVSAVALVMGGSLGVFLGRRMPVFAPLSGTVCGVPVLLVYRFMDNSEVAAVGLGAYVLGTFVGSFKAVMVALRSAQQKDPSADPSEGSTIQ